MIKDLIGQSKVIIYKNIDLFVFVVVSAWVLVFACRMNRSFQDGWVLADLWIYIFILSSVYIFSVSYRTNLQQITILSTIFLFILSTLPALKYTFPYLSTTDVSAHISFSRSIATTGQLLTDEGYASTPGFHALLAIFSQLSGVKAETLARIFPGFIGSFVPFAFYLLCKHSKTSQELAKWIIVLSSFSLPILYTLNGTSFTLPVFIFFLIFVILQISTPIRNGFQYTYLTLLLMIQIIFWHPSTSLVLPFFFISIGSVGLLFPNVIYLSRGAHKFMSLGILAIIGTLTYWMYNAHYVWGQFILNLQSVWQEDPLPNLIPVRFFDISVVDKAFITLLYHARDGVLILTAILGIVFILNSKSVRKNDIIKAFIPIFLISIILLVGIFIIDFSAQGYKRFLFYPVSIAPVLGGFAIWKGTLILKRYLKIPARIISFVILSIILGVSLFQLFPNQNLISLVPSRQYEEDKSPIIWIHQVNTVYQYQMLNFLNSRVNTNRNVYSDYIGVRQESLFFPSNMVHHNIHTWFAIKPGSAFFALHWPGKAGAYTEQAEFRSVDQINRWRTYKEMNVIYDNGGSFILYYPGNAQMIDLQTQ